MNRLPLPAWLIAAVLGCGALPLLVSAAQAQSIAAGTEEQVKAAYLFRILNYVDFPPQALGPAEQAYVIGIWDDDQVAAELTQMSAGKQINGRSLIVRRFGGDTVPAGMHLLFISRTQRARQRYLLHELRQSPVLTVTEVPDGLADGSAVNLRLVDRRVRFEVSLPAAAEAGLKISSRLLGLAFNVVKPD